MTRGLPAAALLVATIGVAPACGWRQTQSAEAGRVLYGQNGCAACHGPNGHGDGPVGRTLDPQPRDFRDASAFKNGTDVPAIAGTIATGVPEGGRMPRFGHLEESERRSLALYVISLRDQSAIGRVQP